MTRLSRVSLLPLLPLMTDGTGMSAGEMAP